MNEKVKSIRNAVIIVAAGRGHRVGGEIPKQYLDIGKVPVLRRTLDIFIENEYIDHIQVVIHPDDQELYYDAIGDIDIPTPVFGGDTRQQSVLNGLEALARHNPEYVYIHDAARPFLSHDLIKQLATEVEISGAVIPALNMTDTVKQMTDDHIEQTINRDILYTAQTPQAFRYKAIFMAHRRFENEQMTDDSMLAEQSGLKVRIIPGERNNFKITTEDDLEKAEQMLGNIYNDFRVGYGVDVHAFEDGDHVILGGVKIDHTKKLKGHSDADVALHAITDAILGAIAKGDIGEHFPPSDDKWKGAGSEIFLSHAAKLVKQENGVISNVDLTIICEEPKIGPHRDLIRERISEIIDVEVSRISVKATTTEKLGFTGEKKGIMAQAVATVRLSG